MRKVKTHFEQIPVEIVRKIACAIPDSHEVPAQNGGESSRARWLELAQKVQEEQDPRKITEWVQELITELDKRAIGKDSVSVTPSQNSGRDRSRHLG